LIEFQLPLRSTCTCRHPGASNATANVSSRLGCCAACERR
jgi:hypothetical protein